MSVVVVKLLLELDQLPVKCKMLDIVNTSVQNCGTSDSEGNKYIAVMSTLNESY